MHTGGPSIPAWGPLEGQSLKKYPGKGSALGREAGSL